jgi:SOS regulatory protein LexA
MSTPDLTKRQLAVLKFIQTFSREEGRSPTLTEIAKGVGSSAVSTIHKHVQHLMDKGFLKRSHGKGNNLVVHGLPGARDSEMAEAGAEAGGATLRGRMPFYGDVAAGTPLLPDSRALPVEVPDTIHRDREDCFVLRVKGDSMIDDAILDGDLVVLQRRGEIRNGDRVVALLDGEEVTLKEFRKDREGVWLIPHNPELKPHCYAHDRVQIQGVLVGVMRSC